MHYWKECGDFFLQCRRHFRSTGAILPSTRFLGRALVSELRKPHCPAHVLEVGPGTGSVTREILRYLRPGDCLDLVEINGDFVRGLTRRFEQDREFWPHRERVVIHEMGVEKLPGEGVYDYIVSGLPLNSFPVGQVREIFNAYDRLLKPGGTLTYYEYVFIRQLTTPFVDRRERRRLACVGRVVGGYIRDFQVRRERIFINVPPATVRHLRLKPAARVSAPAATLQPS